MNRTLLILFAILLAACSQNGDENALDDANTVAEQSEDVATQGGEGAPPPSGSSGNDQAPSAPPPAIPEGDVTLAASPERTRAGATVTLILTNAGKGAIGYNLCTSAIETPSGAEVRTDHMCTMELRTLQPGRNATYGYELPASLPKGRYRFSTGVEHMSGGSRSVAKSNMIEVG